MSWDIYGNPLRRGHCEAHPHIAEEYPCNVCLEDRRQYNLERNRETEHSSQESAEESTPLTVTTYAYVAAGDLTVERIYQRYHLPRGTRTWKEIAQERLGSGTRVHRATLSNHQGDVLEHFGFPPTSKGGDL